MSIEEGFEQGFKTSMDTMGCCFGVGCPWLILIGAIVILVLFALAAWVGLL